MKVIAHWSICAYENHICVKNIEANVVTMDFAVVITFGTICCSNANDKSPTEVKIEYRFVKLLYNV